MSSVAAEPKQSYILWFSQRVGSTLLSQALEDTGVAGRPREWFVGTTPAEVLERNHAQTALDLRKRVWREGCTPNRVAAIKYGMYPQLHGQLTQLMRSVLTDRPDDDRRAWEAFFPNCTHFFLTRRDKVSLAVSWWRAIRSGEWHRPNRTASTAFGRLPDPQPAPREDEYDYDAIAHLMAEAREREGAITGQLDQWDITPHVVVYEDLVASFEPTVRRVLQVLQVDRWNDLAIPEPAFAPLADAVSGAWRRRFLDERHQRAALGK